MQVCVSVDILGHKQSSDCFRAQHQARRLPGMVFQMQQPDDTVSHISFDLAAESKRRHGVAPIQSPGAAKHAGGEDTPTCPIDGETVQGNSKYCGPHTRAQQCIRQQATKRPPGVTKKLKKKSQKRGPAAEQDEESDDDGEQMTDEHKAYIAIFGDRKSKGNELLANQILCTFLKEFPEGKEKKRQSVVTSH